MKIWFDTEFLDHFQTMDFVSLGAVREDGSEFYAEANFDITRANDWVLKNVVPFLTGPVMPLPAIAEEFKTFCGPTPEFWAYYGAWDWMLVCRLMGGFLKLPNTWPGYTNDINTIAVLAGKKDIWHGFGVQEQQGVRHHALADARWTKQAYENMMQFVVSNGA